MDGISVLRRLLLPAAVAAGLVGVAIAAEPAFIPAFANSSTIPENGDLNPYGVAFVPVGFPEGGKVSAGDVLVSNFNNSDNVQGTGTTIIFLKSSGPIAPPGMAEVFFSSEQVGLSTALGVLKAGFVLVGNVPTTKSNPSPGQGSLQVIDRNGHWLQTWTDPVFLDGPWDLALEDEGSAAHVFVSNVLNGTVSRLDVTVGASGLKLVKATTIAKGYTHVPNAAALILGPTGLAFDPASDTLYVASTNDNEIFAVAGARERTTPVNRGTVTFSSSLLRGPLALRLAPNGHLLTANGDAVNASLLHPSVILEFTVTGQFIRDYDVDSSQGGAFGLDAVSVSGGNFNFAAVDDVTNNLTLLHLP